MKRKLSAALASTLVLGAQCDWMKEVPGEFRNASVKRLIENGQVNDDVLDGILKLPDVWDEPPFQERKMKSKKWYRRRNKRWFRYQDALLFKALNSRYDDEERDPMSHLDMEHPPRTIGIDGTIYIDGRRIDGSGFLITSDEIETKWRNKNMTAASLVIRAAGAAGVSLRCEKAEVDMEALASLLPRYEEYEYHEKKATDAKADSARGGLQRRIRRWISDRI